MHSKVQVVSHDDQSSDDDDDELEKAFLENAMNGKKDDKRVEKILKSVKETNEDDDKDLLIDDPNADTEESKIEAGTLEKIIQEKHSNYAKISKRYKLFEYVAKSDPDQILRYNKSRSL
jgi:hypothetical protein